MLHLQVPTALRGLLQRVKKLVPQSPPPSSHPAEAAFLECVYPTHVLKWPVHDHFVIISLFNCSRQQNMRTFTLSQAQLWPSSHVPTLCFPMPVTLCFAHEDYVNGICSWCLMCYVTHTESSKLRLFQLPILAYTSLYCFIIYLFANFKNTGFTSSASDASLFCGKKILPK